MDILSKIIKKVIMETTSDSRGSRGSYVSPLLPGYREFDKNKMTPFTEYVTDWDDAFLDYDSLDGKMERSKKQIGKEEIVADKIYNYIKNHPNATLSDGDGNPINQYPGKKNQNSSN